MRFRPTPDTGHPHEREFGWQVCDCARKSMNTSGQKIPLACDIAGEAPLISPHAVPAAPGEGLLSPRYRALTIAMVSLIAMVAFESMAVATAMPTVAQALHGLSLYALSFGATLAASIVGMVAAGQWTDARGPAPALWTGVAFFVCGLLIDGLAPNMVWLLCGRTVQGCGSGAIFVALYYFSPSPRVILTVH